MHEGGEGSKKLIQIILYHRTLIGEVDVQY
jgi:hypothetical protein